MAFLLWVISQGTTKDDSQQAQEIFMSLHKLFWPYKILLQAVKSALVELFPLYW